jgi:hypothetical protein
MTEPATTEALQQALDAEFAAIDAALARELGDLDHDAETAWSFAQLWTRCVARLRAAKAKQDAVGRLQQRGLDRSA